MIGLWALPFMNIALSNTIVYCLVFLTFTFIIIIGEPHPIGSSATMCCDHAMCKGKIEINYFMYNALWQTCTVKRACCSQYVSFPISLFHNICIYIK